MGENVLYNAKIRITIGVFLSAICFTGVAPAAEYYVSQSGSDFDPGTLELPFATIQKAADVMQAGDVCYIRGGVYREYVRVRNSGVEGSSIRFTAYNGEEVAITGLERVVNWEAVGDGVYRAHVGDEVTQVFVDWERMDIARFPNLEGADLLEPPLLTADAATGVESPSLSTITDDAITQPGGFWNGARLWMLGGDQWVAHSALIADHFGNTLSFDWPMGTGYAYVPEAGSAYFLYGTLDALDTEREWYYDAEENMLYLMAPGGVNPSTLDVGARIRHFVVDLNRAKNIEFSGLTFFAGGVSFEGAENCVLENSLVFYPVPFAHAGGWSFPNKQGVDLQGRGNTVRDCEVAYSWGDGVSISGTNNTVENCLIHDTDWSGTDCAPISTAGDGHLITHNTVYNTGRSAILHRTTEGIRIEHNDIYNYGCLTHDLGATYCYTTDGNGSVIAYNKVHDPKHNERGIYLDNNSSEFIVHHNVVWNCRVGIQTNKDATSHRIYHNTIWNCDNVMTEWGPDGTVIVDQLVYNNIADFSNWIGTDMRRNITVSSDAFVDAAGGDFRLTEDSVARDDYYTLAELTNGGFEDGKNGWSGNNGTVFSSVSDAVHSGEMAAKVIWRNAHTDGITQPIRTVFLDNGMGHYTFEAWVMCKTDDVPVMLKINFVDDTDQDFQYQTVQQSIANEWVKLSFEADISWSGTVQEADFIIMTSEDDTDFKDIYVDDCAVITPLGGGEVSGIVIPGINDTIADGKPDAGAFEYGEAWEAGSNLQPSDIPRPTDNYVRHISLEAELFDDMSGVGIREGLITGCDDGDWIMFRGIDLGDGYATARVRYAAAGSGGGVEIRSGNPDGTLLAEMTLDATGDTTVFSDQTAVLTSAAGINDLYVVFTGGMNIGLFDRFMFEDGSGGGSVPAAPDSIWVENVTTSEATIYWVDVDNEMGYTIERRQGGGAFAEIGVVVRNTTMYQDSGLMSGAGFTYRVRAFNVDGKSAYSDEVTIQTESNLSGGLLIEAESFDEMEGIIDGGTGIGGCDNNDWVKYNAVDLGDGYNSIRIRVAVPDQYAGQKVEVRSGDPVTGVLLGELIVEATGGWGEMTEQRTSLTGASGVHDIYIVFKGSSGVGNFDWFNFEDPVSVSVDEADIPSSFELGQNYPNPFNPVTRISYQLPETAYVRLEIYDILGRRVRTLADANSQAGYFTAVWDGCDDAGARVSSGVYLYRISMRGGSQNYVYSRKMMLMH